MTPGVERAFDSYSNSDVCRYVDYWDGLTARTDAALFRRFLFAFMSVHTTWESNVNGYKAVEDRAAWSGDQNGLRARIRASGVGLHNNRARWIDQFDAAYWRRPADFRRQPRESWASCRDRIEALVTGLGPAKVSFALELAFPLEAEVVCLDVHMLRLYGKKSQSLKVGEYARYEADWVGRSRACGLPPYIIKQIHWDAVQGRPDSRYWSYVFE